MKKDGKVRRDLPGSRRYPGEGVLGWAGVLEYLLGWVGGC